jgi:GNAT superfamily N-acetyltransferase
MYLTISELKNTDKKIISFIRTRLAKRWKTTATHIHKNWINPALENESFPYIFIARVKQEFAGKIFLFIDPDGYLNIKDQPWITALYVKEKFRGQKIAQHLIQVAKKTAKNNGYNDLYLDTASQKGYYEYIGGWELIGTAMWEEGGKEVSIMKSLI